MEVDEEHTHKQENRREKGKHDRKLLYLYESWEDRDGCWKNEYKDKTYVEYTLKYFNAPMGLHIS